MGTLLNAPDSKVLFEQHSADVFEFKLNQNKTLNSLDSDMVHLLLGQLNNWSKQSKNPRVALISGTGGKAFCAGGDIVSLYHANAGKPGTDPKVKATFFADEYLADYALTTMKPL